MATGDQADIFGRLRRLLAPWFGDDDAQSSVVAAFLQAPAWALAGVHELLAYAKLQTRIATATDGWLELIAYDFFGDGLPRLQGEQDSAYGLRIRREILRPRVTRAAIEAAMREIPGQANAVRVYEPFNIRDTGAYGYGGKDWALRLQKHDRINLALLSDFKPAYSGETRVLDGSAVSGEWFRIPYVASTTVGVQWGPRAFEPSPATKSLSFVAYVNTGSATAISQLYSPSQPALALASQAHSITTTPTRFQWNNFGSSSPLMSSALLQLIFNSLTSGQVVTVRDIMVSEGNSPTTYWLPSPSEPSLERFGSVVDLRVERPQVAYQGVAYGRAGRYGSRTAPYEVNIHLAPPQGYGIPIRSGWGSPRGGYGRTDGMFALAGPSSLIGAALVTDILAAVQRVRAAGVTAYVFFDQYPGSEV